MPTREINDKLVEVLIEHGILPALNSATQSRMRNILMGNASGYAAPQDAFDFVRHRFEVAGMFDTRFAEAGVTFQDCLEEAIRRAHENL